MCDRSRSTVRFEVGLLGIGRARGSFERFDIAMTTGDRLEQTSASVEIEVASIETGDRARNEQHQDADVFDAAHHPHMTFDSTVVSVGEGDGDVRVEGPFTLRGITRTRRFDLRIDGPVTSADGSARLALCARGTIDRRDFGVRWAAVTPTGEFLLGDRVRVRIDAMMELALTTGRGGLSRAGRTGHSEGAPPPASTPRDGNGARRSEREATSRLDG